MLMHPAKGGTEVGVATVSCGANECFDGAPVVNDTSVTGAAVVSTEW